MPLCRPRRHASLYAAIFLTLASTPLLAEDYYFIGPSGGSYSDPNNWSDSYNGAPGSPPGPNDNAKVDVQTNFSINIDGTPNSAGVNAASFQAYPPSSLTLTQSTGTFNVNYLSFGPNTTYNLSGNAVVTATTQFTLLGGTINQLGGSFGTNRTDLHIGSDIDYSYYNLSAGSITADDLRLDGAYSVFAQTGGSIAAGRISVGDNDVFIMTAGTIALQGSLDNGYSSGAVRNTSASFYQFAGSITCSGFFVESAQNSTSLYTLAGGSLQLGSSSSQIGVTNSATFVQSGGTFAGANLAIAVSPTSSASYTLSTGSVSFNSLTLAYQGHATFTQSGGGASFPSITLASSPNSSATYTLSNGFLNSTSVSVGPAGYAYFDQSGGFHTTSSLAIGSPDHSDPHPTYDLTGGTLSVSTIINYGVFFLKGGSLTFTGTNPTFTNYSSATFNGSQSWPANSTLINSGSASFNQDPSFYSSPTLSILSTGQLLFDSPYIHLISLSLSASSHAAVSPPSYSIDFSYFYTCNLSITDTAQLDVTTAPLIVDYTSMSPIDTVRSLLRSNQLFSSASDATHTLVYAEASALSNSTAAKIARSSSFDNTTLFLTLALIGDANLDGKVNADDYTLIDRAYAQHLPDPHWTDGDFNYDGVIDQSDYLLIDRALYQAQGFSPGFLTERESQFGSTYVTELLSSLPDPSLSSITLSSLLLLRRRCTSRVPSL